LLPRAKVRRLLTVNLVAFMLIGLLGELGFRLLWNPKYWMTCDRWWIGSGQTVAGRKWWPETTYFIDSREFHVAFRTNARGYRARPLPPKTPDPYRIAFVGDSFTEGMQVDYDKTFCALLERGLAQDVHPREIVCENYGISATGLLEYWHRVAHDVLEPKAPQALVLCLYPGNDFSIDFPDAAFQPDGRPRREFYCTPTRLRHLVTWVNLKSRFGSYLQKSFHVLALRTARQPEQGPKLWWVEPEVAARAADAPAIRRSRALLAAIDEDCRRHGTKLCILVVGPVATYFAKDGRSPLRRILDDWKLDIPVIDYAVEVIARPDYPSLLFPRDGHLNESGHQALAANVRPALEKTLDLPVAARIPR
jgi:lysophospholipase L1-like esterase